MGWTERTDPMPYTDIAFFTTAGKGQSSQCQSSQTPTNPTSDESRRVLELLQGTKTSCLTLAKNSFRERYQHPECREDLHRSYQSQRRVQGGFKKHICRRGFKKHTCRRPTEDGHGDPKPADRLVHSYCDPATHQHQPWT